MGMGIPGAGKTTALKPFAQKHSYTYISPDDIRAELSGDAMDHSRNGEVWDEARKRTVEALSKGETVVFDATFAKDFERKDFVRFVRDNGAEKVQGVFADVAFEVANERNNARERVIPEHAMKRMDGMIQKNPPAIEDGFDSMFRINEIQELQSVEIRGEHESHVREFKTKLR